MQGPQYSSKKMLQINLPTYIDCLSCLITVKPWSQSRTSNELFGLQKFKAASASKSLSCPVQLSLPFQDLEA